MLTAHFPSAIRRRVVTEVLGDEGWSHFWSTRFFPRWLPVLLGLCLGLVIAYLIAQGSWHFAVPLALAVPAVILFNRYPFVAVMLWVLVLPYFLNEPTAAGRFVYWIVHRAMIPATLGIVVLSGWLGTRKRNPVRLGRAELAMLLFLGLAFFNVLLFNRNPVQMLIKFYDLLFVPFCAYWLIRLIAPTAEDLKRLLPIAWITVLVQCAIGLLSWFAPQVLPAKWLTGLEGARTVGTLRNPAVYTSTLLFLSLLLLQYGVHCKSNWRRWLLFWPFGLAVFCVFFSFSRASWVGGILVLVALMFVYPRSVIPFVVLLVAMTSVLVNTILVDEVAWGYERVTGEEATRSAEGRLITNQASLGMIESKPLLGWGFGNYELYDRQFQGRVNDVPVRGDDTSHNTYLTIMAELGVIAFLLYVFPLLWWLVLSIKVWRRLPQGGFWSRSLLVMLWLLILHMTVVTNFMDMVRFHLFGTAIWWMALALIGNMVYLYCEPDHLKPPNLDLADS